MKQALPVTESEVKLFVNRFEDVLTDEERAVAIAAEPPRRDTTKGVEFNETSRQTYDNDPYLDAVRVYCEETYSWRGLAKKVYEESQDWLARLNRSTSFGLLGYLIGRFLRKVAARYQEKKKQFLGWFKKEDAK